MIFLSHNHKDKSIVEEIAIRLCDIFGQDQIFYDSWSIQPGDGIIDKMNEGLSECRFFLLFVSKNSLQSNMVKLEWQNALYKATQGEIKVIPVKLDDCMMPQVLLQNLYIDLYGNGLEVAIRRIVDVISGCNTFRRGVQEFSNLKAYVYTEGTKTIIECHAEHFLEPISNFLFLVTNNEEELVFKCKSSNEYVSGFNKNIRLENGRVYNGQLLSIEKATVPGFPFVIEITPKNDSQVTLVSVMHEKKRGEWRSIPMVNGRKLHNE